MNKKGFTLIELLATLIILGIVVSITVLTVTGAFNRAKDSTEDVFINTLNDAIKLYIESDGISLTYSKLMQGDKEYKIKKTNGSVSVEKANENVSFDTIMNSTYKPLSFDDFVNPANKYALCNKDALVNIYRDSDYVYYYSYSGLSLGCIVNNDNVIGNLPELIVE